MAKYTTEVLSIVYANSNEKSPLLSRIDEANKNYIFNFDYPIWEEGHRIELERKITLHYLRREIGLETVEMWRTYLIMKMNEIMPYYVELYKTIVKDYNIKYDVDITETLKRTVDSKANETGKATATTNQDGTTNSNTLIRDYPQAQVNPDRNSLYASGAQQNEGTTNLSGKDITDSERTRTGNDTEETTKTRKGLSGNRSLAQMIKDYRAMILNIDMQIINDLSSLFMGVY